MGAIRYRCQRGEYAHPSFTLGEIIVAMIQTAGAIARRAYARHRQRRQVTATCDALRRLDDCTLRDLGFDRSEIASVAAELRGDAERTRVRAIALAETRTDATGPRTTTSWSSARRAMRHVYLYALAARWCKAVRRFLA
jgi:uncharacterized protein YjiS (DUF1127 family)